MWGWNIWTVNPGWLLDCWLIFFSPPNVIRIFVYTDLMNAPLPSLSPIERVWKSVVITSKVLAQQWRRRASLIHLLSMCRVVKRIHCCFRLTKAVSQRRWQQRPVASWVSFVSRSRCSLYFPPQDESRVKVTVMEVQPVNHREHSRRLLNNISKLIQWTWGGGPKVL